MNLIKKDKNRLTNKKIIFFEMVSILFLGIWICFRVDLVLGIALGGILELLFYLFGIRLFFRKNEFQGFSKGEYATGFALALVLGFAIAFLTDLLEMNFDLADRLIAGLLLSLTASVPMMIGIHLDRKDKKEKAIINSCLAISVFVLCFYYFIDIPSEIYLANNSEFAFSYLDLLKSLIPLFVVFLGSISIMYVLPMIAKKILATVLCVEVIGSYLQVMFFNGYIGDITGARFFWKTHMIYSLVGLLVWIAAAIFVIWLHFIKKKNVILTFLCAAVGVLILTSYVFVVVRTDKEGISRKQYYLNSSEQFTVGKDENVIILIADAVDNSFIQEIYEKNPEKFEPFKDFVMYTDTCSVYDTTGASVQQMMYGYTQKDGTENTNLFFGRFHDAGYRMLMFHAASLGIGMKNRPTDYIDNYFYSEDTNDVLYVNNQRIRNGMMTLAIFKVLPCVLKESVHVEDVSFDSSIVYSTSKYEVVKDNEDFESLLDLKYNPESDKCFIYNHLEGAHFPCDDYIEETEYCLSIFAEYIEQMKQLGVYDNSVIVIAADHGLHDDAEGLPFGIAATPMFMVKRKGEAHKRIQLSSKPIYYRDFQATMLEYAGLYDDEYKNVFGKTIDDYSEGEIRTRIWFDQGFDHSNEWRKYTFSGDYNEFKRVVEEDVFEAVPDGTFDFSEIGEE